jgi:hypothetical protein
VLGKKKGRAVLLPFQLIVLLGVAITYTVVSTSLLLMMRLHKGQNMPFDQAAKGDADM